MKPIQVEFPGKVVLVTGAAMGIGRATALEFAARGAQVAALDRNEEVLKETVKGIGRGGGQVIPIVTDVSSGEQVQAAIRQIEQQLGGLDVVVNNAGIQRYGTVTETSEELWDEVMAVNLRGVFLVSKYALPLLIRRGGGVIVNVGSVQSVGALANAAAYITAKHGVLGLTRSMAVDYARYNIRVHCVCPGAIDTPLLRWAASLSSNPEQVLEACRRVHLLNRMGQPEEVARVIAFLASDLASFMTGHPVMVDGGAMALIGGREFMESGTGARES